MIVGNAEQGAIPCPIARKYPESCWSRINELNRMSSDWSRAVRVRLAGTRIWESQDSRSLGIIWTASQGATPCPIAKKKKSPTTVV